MIEHYYHLAAIHCLCEMTWWSKRGSYHSAAKTENELANLLAVSAQEPKTK